jgi:hypothetical protein
MASKLALGRVSWERMRVSVTDFRTAVREARQGVGSNRGLFWEFRESSCIFGGNESFQKLENNGTE